MPIRFKKNIHSFFYILIFFSSLTIIFSNLSLAQEVNNNLAKPAIIPANINKESSNNSVKANADIVPNITAVENRSLIYSDQEMDWLHKALESYEKNIPLSELLPDLFPFEEVKKIDTKNIPKNIVIPPTKESKKEYASSIYLSSILFTNANDWTIWLDGNKITSKDSHDFLKIKKINSEKIVLLWLNSPLAQVISKMEDDLSEYKNLGYLTNNKNIMINKLNNDIAFILKPNQSFAVNKLDIIEGKLIAEDKNNDQKADIIVQTSKGDSFKEVDAIINPVIIKKAPKIEKKYKEQLELLANILRY